MKATELQRLAVAAYQLGKDGVLHDPDRTTLLLAAAELAEEEGQLVTDMSELSSEVEEMIEAAYVRGVVGQSLFALKFRQS